MRTGRTTSCKVVKEDSRATEFTTDHYYTKRILASITSSVFVSDARLDEPVLLAVLPDCCLVAYVDGMPIDNQKHHSTRPSTTLPR